MKAEKLSTEIAALERQSSKAKNAVIKKVLAKKIDKLKSELESITSEETAKENIKKAKTKVNAMDAKQFEAYIKNLAKDPKFSFLKNMTSNEIVRDMKRTAKPVGWRFRGRDNAKTPTKKDIKDKNNVYYEGRRNRSDVSRSVRLADGGGVNADENLFSKGEVLFLFKGNKANDFYESITNMMPDHEITMVNDNKVQAFFGNYSDLEDAMQMAKSMGMTYQGKYANGGGVDINDWDMPVIRTQFEDEEFEYAKGGETGEPHRTTINGMMAKGGAIQHGLQVGDKIVADQFWENTIVVENDKTKKRAVVYLETGKRKEA